jgi:retron-type reverse transcriptase|tara:strand:- start:24198 stop:24431 length:234 start_codon:yes stop_codon:yes gene_type:complete
MDIFYVVLFFCFADEVCQQGSFHEYHVLFSDKGSCRTAMAEAKQRVDVHGLIVQEALCIPENEYMDWVQKRLIEEEE